MTIPGVVGTDTYKIIRDSPEYPSVLIVTHYENIRAYNDTLKNPERE
jgi:hypothetical protein